MLILCLYLFLLYSSHYKCASVMPGTGQSIEDVVVRISEKLKMNNKSISDVAVEYRALSPLVGLTKYDVNGKYCFYEQCFSNFTEGLPIYVRIVEEELLYGSRIGNRMGWLLNDYACALASGAHFILILDPDAVRKVPPEVLTESIVGYIPYIVPHLYPAASITESIAISKRICKQPSFDWELGANDALLDSKAAHFIRKLVHKCITSVGDRLLQNNRYRYPHNIMHTTMVSNRERNIESYPLVSDVAVHYRCSDNVQHPVMGLLPFETIISVIPKKAQSIYIHTEGTYKEHICSHIIQSLFTTISDAFPDAIVAVFVKENIYSTMYNIVHCRMALICSPSTFCIHAALGKSKGAVYAPPSFYDGKTNFSYDDWHYLNVTPRHKWPNGIHKTFRGRQFILQSLGNITKYYSS